MTRNQARIAAATDTYANSPPTAIAMIRGCCHGGGAALAVVSGFRVATGTARFALHSV